MADDEMDYEDEAPSNDVYSFLLIIAFLLMGVGSYLVYQEMNASYGKEVNGPFVVKKDFGTTK